MAKYQWWEKTVEYAFLAAAIGANRCAFVAPLAGIEEHMASDAIYSPELDCFTLIEFKRNYGEISKEEAKFNDYESAKTALRYFPHHHIIYATKLDGPSHFELVAQPYFAKNVNQPQLALNCLNAGATSRDFKVYLTELSTQKRPYGDGGGGSGEFSVVLGISGSKLLYAATLKEFSPDLFPSPDAVKKRERRP